MQKNNDNFKSYTEQVPFNNVPCASDEVLAPVVLTEDMKEMLKLRGLKQNNIRSWKFPFAKKCVPVAFIPIKPEEMASNMQYFNRQVHVYLNGEKNPLKETLSIEDFLSKNTEDGEKGFDPTEVSTDPMDFYAMMFVNDLIEYLETIDPAYGVAFSLLFYGRKKGIAAEVFGLEKSQAYDKLKEVQQIAADYYKKHYKD